MFKWSCFGVAVIFLAAVGWMLNDIRLEVRQAGEMARATSQTVNQHLPTIVDRSKQITEVVATRLPEVVEKVKITTDVTANLADDIKQVRQLLVGDSKGKREENLLAYANGVVETIGKSGGAIGLKPLIPGKGPTTPVPAQDWASKARREALGLAILGTSKKDMVTELSRNWFRAAWYIQTQGEKSVPLLDWLKVNHAPTRELWAQQK
ncbi:MAG: hypothetical protein L0Z62_26300 [Gemmataceae bacterium]|nr:hypothetical protein [Gemmataceae bacterium]